MLRLPSCHLPAACESHHYPAGRWRAGNDNGISFPWPGLCFRPMAVQATETQTSSTLLRHT